MKDVLGLRKLYHWVLSWADSKYGLPALVVLSFTESSFFPIPPDPLLMALCFGRPDKWFKFALWCTAASVAGAVLGWWIGWGFWEAAGDFFFQYLSGVGFTPENFDGVQNLYQEYGFWAVLGAAFTPIPYKVFTIASGVFNYSLAGLIGASVIGRGARFLLVAGLIRLGGVKIRPFLEKHFELIAILSFGIGILGFLAIKLL